LLPLHVYPPAVEKGRKRTAFFEQAIKRIETLPGVQSASVVSMLPLNRGLALTTFPMPILFEGVPAPEIANRPRADVRMINSNFFRTMGIPLLKGRDFTEREIIEYDARVIIINETMARRFWPNENPLGRRIKLNREEHWDEIIGVAGDVKISDLDAEVTPTVYWPHHSWAFGFGAVLVRTTVDPVSLTAAVTREIHSLDPELAVADVRTMEQVLWRSVARPRFNTLLLAVLGAVALALAVVGIYGVISYAVSQRTPEIGIRMAIGARPRDVLKLVVKHGMTLTLAGVGVGLVASYALTRVLSGLLYGVRPTDPATFIGVSLLLSAVALLACYIPARRAAKLDPMETLRHQ
ncbi:MAG: FtsX-like permease family protein, partial [Blastocatellia bacterium]